MSDFAFLYRGRDSNASPEQMQNRMEKCVYGLSSVANKVI